MTAPSVPSSPASPSPNSGGSRGVHVPGVSPAQKRAIGSTPKTGNGDKAKVKPGRKPPAAPKPQPKRRGK